MLLWLHGSQVLFNHHLFENFKLVESDEFNNLIYVLTGSEGEGVADVLFGDYGFTGKLARTWLKRVDQLPMNVGDQHYDPLFPFGFGLTTNPLRQS
jgi:hypothetical protein